MNIDEFPTVEGFDPLSPEFLANPAPHVRKAQDTAPVFYYHPLRMWIITSYEDICKAARDYKTFSSKALGLVPPPEDLVPLVPERMEEQFIIAIDPPEHNLSRRSMAPLFGPRSMEKLEKPIRDIANRYIDAFISKGECDLMHEFCYPLSLDVIVTLLGVPRDRFDDFRQWTDDVFAVFTPKSKYAAEITKPMPDDERREHWLGLIEYNKYFDELLTDREVNPRDDLLSAMAHAADREGNRLIPREKVLRHIQELIAAGNDTTANTIGAMVHLLTEHPDQLEKIRSNPALMPNAVEEALRIRGTSPGLFRITTRDVEIGGATIPEGSSVWLLFAGAGYDETKFEDALVFDVERENASEHLAFGHGRHTCIGNPLARLEAICAVEELYRRIPDIRVKPNQQLDYLPVLTVLTLTKLIVEWDSG